MTATVLVGGIQLGGRPMEIRQPEIRVVAETGRTARLVNDESFPHALGCQRRRVRIAGHEYQDAAVPGATRVQRRRLERGEQFRVVRGIIGANARIARRVNSGCSAERIHLQARIVRNSRRPGHFRRMACLQPRILQKTAARFLGRGYAHIALRNDVERQVGEQRAKFARFPGIAAGDDQRRTPGVATPRVH